MTRVRRPEAYPMDPGEGKEQTRRHTGAAVPGERWSSMLPLIDQGGWAGEDGRVKFRPDDQMRLSSNQEEDHER